MEVEENNKRYILCQNPELAQEKSKLRASFKDKFELEIVNIQKRYKKIQTQCTNNKQRKEA